MELIDTHCHLHLDPLRDALPEVLARARAAGVTRCVTLATSLATSRETIAMAREQPMLGVAVGIHPEEADGVTPAMVAQLEPLLDDPAVVAVGEMGLDDYWRQDRLEPQAAILREQLRLAQRRRLPACIHCRGTRAYARLLEVLREVGPVRGVLHCASGTPGFVREAVGLGLHVSFAGTVTFPKAQAIRDLVAAVPDDRLLVETDAPFLAPQPVRGRTNEPAYVAHTAADLARLRGVAPETLAALTTRNARALFRFPTD